MNILVRGKLNIHDGHILPASRRFPSPNKHMGKCKSQYPQTNVDDTKASFSFEVQSETSEWTRRGSFSFVHITYSTYNTCSVKCYDSMAPQKIFMGKVLNSVTYGGHLCLVCAVCDVAIWRHILVSKPKFWRSFLTQMHILLHALPFLYVSLHWI